MGSTARWLESLVAILTLIRLLRLHYVSVKNIHLSAVTT